MYYLPQFRTTTLNVPGGITISQTTGIILTSIPSDLDITKPGIICITYANPLNTDVAEFITYTSIDGTNTLQGATRAGEGYAAKAHLNSATIAWVVSKSHINNVNDKLTGVDTVALEDTSGNEFLKTSKTTSAVNEWTIGNEATGVGPLISATGGDTNIDAHLSSKGTGSVIAWAGAKARELLKLLNVASAVNELSISPAVTGSGPIIAPTGDDTNIDLNINGKGSGMPKLNTQYGAITADTDGATITFDLSVTNRHSVILGGNRTLAISNAKSGQIVFLELIQDGTGTRTVTWFVGPALTVTMTIATPGVVTSGQDIPTGTPVVFTTTGALPTGLTAGTTYWWTRVSATTGNVSTSLANCQAGTLIATSGSQSGVHTMKTAIRWALQTAPTLTTSKFLGDIIQIYVKDATAGVYEGLVAVQAI